MRTRPIRAAVICALIFLAAACVDDDGVVDATLLVDNESDFAITELYLTEVDNPDWGPDLLFGDLLLPGEELVLEVECDFYDALLIDEDGVECEIRGIDLCLNDAQWVIRNETCVVFEASAAAAEQAPR